MPLTTVLRTVPEAQAEATGAARCQDTAGLHQIEEHLHQLGPADSQRSQYPAQELAGNSLEAAQTQQTQTTQVHLRYQRQSGSQEAGSQP